MRIALIFCSSILHPFPFPNLNNNIGPFDVKRYDNNQESIPLIQSLIAFTQIALFPLNSINVALMFVNLTDAR